MALQVQASILSRVYAYSQALRDPVTLLVVVRDAVGSPVQGLSGTFSRVVFRESGGTVPLNPDPQVAQIAAASGAETGFALVPISMWDDVDDLREYVKSMATQIAGIASRLGV